LFVIVDRRETVTKFISFYTDAYETPARMLMESAQKHGVDLEADHISGYKSYPSDWSSCVRHKPRFIHSKMVAMKGKTDAIVWVDADAIINKEPASLKKLNCDIAFATFNAGKGAKEPVAAVLYFKNTQKVRTFVYEWAAATENLPVGAKRPEQRSLMALLEKSDLKVTHLTKSTVMKKFTPPYRDKPGINDAEVWNIRWRPSNYNPSEKKLEVQQFNPVIIGKYVTGRGTARPVYDDPKRKTELTSIFGCPMIGTFNVECNRAELVDAYRNVEPTKHGFWTSRGKPVPVDFYLVQLSIRKASFMAWAVKWKEIDRFHTKTAHIELLSKTPIPDKFKKGVAVEFCSRWPKKQVSEWWPTAYDKWFQTFDWGPTRADSMKVWNLMFKHVDWSGKRVLDIGCNTGRFSFEAARYGAYVDAVDVNKKTLDIATQIGKYVECADVNFLLKDPGGTYDAIFYLSVHHQIDPSYDHLSRTINSLRRRCKTLFVELLTPPPKTKTVINDEVIQRMVCGDMLSKYKHVVRCTRSVYLVKGFK